jgi:hypothetical protein
VRSWIVELDDSHFPRLIMQQGVIPSVAAALTCVHDEPGDRRIQNVGDDTAGRSASVIIDPSGAAVIHRTFWHGAAAPSG